MKKYKFKMPKTRIEFETYIINAFMAGCIHGYAIEHTSNVYEQEKTGALLYIGKITEEEYEKKMSELQE